MSLNGSSRSFIRPGRLSIPLIADYFTGVDPGVLFKNPGFEDEREVRVTWTVNPWWKFVLYRASRFGVTPYVEVGPPPTPSPATWSASGVF
jgi:hypothetical protein